MHIDFYVAQSFILTGYIIFFISRFKKSKTTILITDNISRLCFIVGYIFLHSINSIEHTVYGIIRNFIGAFLTKKNKKSKYIYFVIMSVLLFIMYGTTFNGISTIMFTLSGLINLFAVLFAKEQGIRIGTVCAAVCNVTAFLIIGSYASIIGESLCCIISFISFVKEDKNENKRKSNT